MHRCRQQQRGAEAQRHNELRVDANNNVDNKSITHPDYGYNDLTVTNKLARVYAERAGEVVYVHVVKQKPFKVVVMTLAELRAQNQSVSRGNFCATSTNTKQMRGRVTQVRKINK